MYMPYSMNIAIFNDSEFKYCTLCFILCVLTLNMPIQFDTKEHGSCIGHRENAHCTCVERWFKVNRHRYPIIFPVATQYLRIIPFLFISYLFIYYLLCMYLYIFMYVFFTYLYLFILLYIRLFFYFFTHLQMYLLCIYINNINNIS